MQRIFKKGVNGIAIPVPYALCEQTGQVSPAPLAAESKQVSQMAVLTAGFPLYTENQLQSFMLKSNQKNQFAVQDAETARGARTDVRIESSRRTGSGGDKRINITLRNTSADTDYSVLIGDSAGIIALDATDGGLGIGTKPADIEVDGKWGASTLDVLSRTMGYAPHDFHGCQIEATNIADDSPNSSYRTAGRFQYVKAPINGDNPHVFTFELFPLIGTSSYNRNIFELRNFREQVGPMDAFLVKIPSGVRVDISLQVEAAGLGSAMELV